MPKERASSSQDAPDKEAPVWEQARRGALFFALGALLAAQVILFGAWPAALAVGMVFILAAECAEDRPEDDKAAQARQARNP